MSRRSRRAVARAVLAAAFAACPAAAEIISERGEIDRVLEHGPWAPPRPRDPSNGVSGDPVAIRLGQRRLFDRRLSAEGAVACASCQLQHVTFGQFKRPSRRSVAVTAPSMHDSRYEMLTVPDTTASRGSPPRFAGCESSPG